MKVRVSLGDKSPIESNICPGWRLIVTDMDTGKILPVSNLKIIVENDHTKPIMAEVTLLVSDIDMADLPVRIIAND
jgi:hypothetical protein